MSIELVRTPHGWAYPDPGPCACGEVAAMRGFQFCRCAGTDSGGHPEWRCKACDRTRTLGCVGHVEVSNEYGGRAGSPRGRPVHDRSRDSCRIRW